jgi:hypothetical protein
MLINHVDTISQCVRRAVGINFIRYAQLQKIGEQNSLLKFVGSETTPGQKIEEQNNLKLFRDNKAKTKNFSDKNNYII